MYYCTSTSKLYVKFTSCQAFGERMGGNGFDERENEPIKKSMKSRKAKKTRRLFYLNAMFFDLTDKC